MRHFGRRVALVAAFLAAAGLAHANDAILLTGGMITTNADGATAEALVARGGRITFVGSAAQAKAHAPDARVVDLKGGFAYPGFVDSHAHLLGIGFREMTLDLAGVRSLKELQTALGAHAARHPTQGNRIWL
jgi:predicted amidohydrolase YtcJ